MLTQLAQDREPELASAAFKREWAGSPGRRSITRRQLQDVGLVEFLASDDVSRRTLWDAEPIARLAYYKVVAGGQTHFVTVAITADGKVARLDIPFQPGQ